MNNKCYLENYGLRDLFVLVLITYPEIFMMITVVKK